MDISIYIKPLIKWWRLLVVSTLLAIVASSVAAIFQPPVYVSRTTLITGRSISNLNPDAGQIYIAQQLAAVYADIASREPVQAAAMEKLGLEQLPKYEALVVPNTYLIEISVTDTIPERAQMVAAELANQLILQGPSSGNTAVSEQQDFVQRQLTGLQNQISEAEEEIEELQASLSTINSASQRAYIENQVNQLSIKLNDMRGAYAGLLYNTYSGGLNNLTIIEPANLPFRSVATNKFLIIALAALVGLSLGAGAAYILEYLDKSIKTTSDVERIFKVPVIGYLPVISDGDNNSTYILDYPNSVVAESVRLIQANLEFLGVENHSRTILVTSPGQGNGKTTVAVNLALSIAQSEQRAVLVDADMRRPAIHTALNLKQSPGLSEMIRGRKEIDAALQPWNDSMLEVLVAGETIPNITQIAGSKRIASILDELKETFEVVIVDAPPLVISDAYNLASKVDGVILILEPGQTSEEQAKGIKEQIDRAGIDLIGVVFNRLSTAVAKSYGDYQYLSMYSPQQYSDYVSNTPARRMESSRSGKFMDFIEHGKMPLEVQSAITAIRTQPRNLVNRIKKKPRKNIRDDKDNDENGGENKTD